MYDLKVEGLIDFRRTIDRPVRVARDVLEGIANGSNTVYRSRFYPICTTPVPIVYTSGSLSQSSYAIDYESGTVVFNAGPTSQPSMDYKWVRMPDVQVIDALVAGFYELEARWTRGWKLVDSTGAEVSDVSSADRVYVADGSGVDPTVTTGGLFSASVVQRAVLMACTRYAYLFARLSESAETSFSYREDRGVAVDKSAIPRNLALALDQAAKDVEKALTAAQGGLIGQGIKSPATIDYMEDYEWQTESINQDHRTTYANQG